MSPVVDLRSDTKTKPTAPMRAAIAAAEVGDEQIGEDPTCNALQDRVAELLGKETAMFVATGTMCNNLAVAAQTAPGDAVVVDARAHILRSESGGPAVLSSVVLDQIDGERGHFTAEQLAPRLGSGSHKAPRTSLVCVEQTHNFAGGSVWPFEQFAEVCAAAADGGAAVHVDGARLFNAVVASGIEARRWAEPADSIWIDFTKGLGAPVGAVLAGGAEFIARAQRFKHVFGGALRQAGIVAAGCDYALDHHIDRLADDHARAQRLADGLAAAGLPVERPVETNMVFFEPQGGAQAFLAALADHGVLMSAVGPRVRAITHLDIADADIERALEAALKVQSRS